jgi:site-specific DNA recombinase
MSTTKMPNAVAYVRVSTVEQAREGWSLTVQRRRVRAYCEARGWRLSKVYADEGISSAARRPAFEQMVNDVLADGVDAIVAMKLDRLGRSAAGLLSLYEQLERKGVRIVTIEDGIDTSTANGRLMRTILAALAEWERDVIRDRTRSGVRAAMDDGRRVGQPPYGHTVREGRLVEHPEEQRILRRIRSRHAAGASLATIARELNAAGTSPRRGRWHPTTVARTLSA